MEECKSLTNLYLTIVSGGQLEDAAEKIHRLLQPVDLSESQEPNSYPQEPNTYLRQINSYLRVMQDGINEYAMYRCVHRDDTQGNLMCCVKC